MEIGLIRSERGTEVERGICVGTASVFPLGLTGQDVMLAATPAQTQTKLLSIMPTHLFHWPMGAFELGRIRRESTLHELPSGHQTPLGLGYRCLGEIERFKDHLMLGALIPAPPLLGRGAHLERSPPDFDHIQGLVISQWLPKARR
jgi:hypothetical protein